MHCHAFRQTLILLSFSPSDSFAFCLGYRYTPASRSTCTSTDPAGMGFTCGVLAHRAQPFAQGPLKGCSNSAHQLGASTRCVNSVRQLGAPTRCVNSVRQHASGVNSVRHLGASTRCAHHIGASTRCVSSPCHLGTSTRSIYTSLCVCQFVGR